MKKNFPITQNEIILPYERLLVSKTDIKGVITYANDEFVAISGFSREELLGQSHNIVRHPEMPPQAFEDLWTTLKAGRPWRGMVKNRCKNGDFYWVDANVVPVTEDGKVVSYMSVRTRPTREQVVAAEALYRRLSAAKQRMPGKPLSPFASLRRRLLAFALVMLVIFIVAGGLVWRVMDERQQALDAAYREQATPALALQETLALMDGAYKHVALGVMHNPAGGTAKLHQHPLTGHLDAAKEKIAAIRKLRPLLEQRKPGAHEQAMMAAFKAACEEYIANGLLPAIVELEAGRYDQAAVLTEEKLLPFYEQAKARTKELNRFILDEQAAAQQAAQVAHERFVDASIWFAALCILLVVSFLVLMTRSLMGPIHEVIHYFRRISEGILTDEVDIGRQGEFGEIFSALAVMQTNIKVMIDNIQSAVRSLEQNGADLDAQMFMVTMQSRQQQQDVTGVAVTTEEFSQAVQEVAVNAKQTADYAQGTERLVGVCNETIANSQQASMQVVDTVNETSRILGNLSQRIQTIGDVTQTIKEIADQTNLLALNAAIEAARAGEAGRGFAVVADEVRNLSESTAKSTVDIGRLIADIRDLTGDAVEAMRQAVSEVDLGGRKMQDGVDELAKIIQASHAVNEMAQQIASAAHQQAIAGESVAASMESVALMVERNTEIAQQAQDLSNSLMSTAARLKKSMGKFQLFPVFACEETPLPCALGAPRFIEM